MTDPTTKHIWVSNAAFTRLTGIKRVCMTCGAGSGTALRECPGKRRGGPTR